MRRRREKRSGTHVWRGEWRFGGVIWSGLKIEVHLEALLGAGDDFLHQTFKFWSRGAYGGPC
jgi:hypothetical protein